MVTRKGRIDDDINLGFWMARMHDLRVVRLRRVVWKDTWRGGADASKVLAAHKMPWSLHDELYNTTVAMWRAASAVQVDAICRSDVPPCTGCSHARSQRPCVLEVTLETSAPPATECIHAPKRGLRCPRFARESHPEPPSQTAAAAGACVAAGGGGVPRAPLLPAGNRPLVVAAATGLRV